MERKRMNIVHLASKHLSIVLLLCMTVLMWPAPIADNYGMMQASAADNIRETDVKTAADGNEIVLVDGSFVYMSKDQILNRINEIRLEACKKGVWDPRNPSRKLTEADYVPLKWSSDLEWIAQTRAAEATVHMAHERPNGGDWNSVSHNGVLTYAEDLAWNGSTSILGGINQWYGEKTAWVNKTEGAVTGHYTSIISPNYKYIGIGAFEPASKYGAIAGELTMEDGLSESQIGVNGPYKQKVEVKKSNLSINPVDSCTVHIGKAGNAGLNAKTSYERKGSQIVSPVNLQGVTYKSSDTKVAMVDTEGKVIGKTPGSANISISYGGSTYTTSVTVEDHDYQLNNSVDPTCTEEGSKTYVCSVCEDSYTETIAAKGHKWNESATVDKAATCTAEGSQSIHCSVCNDVKPGSTETIAKLAHKYGDWKTTKEATCTDAGSREKVCADCGDKVTETIAAKGHTWNKSATVDKAATCTAEGSQSIHCSVCNDVKPGSTETIAKLAHKYGDWKTTKEATCTDTGSREKVCADCGDKVTETIAAKGHTWNESATVDKAATCTAEGSQSIRCSVCNDVKPGSTETIAKLAHKYGDWKTTKEATCTDTGSREKVCADCGDKVTETIAAKGHTWNKNRTVDKAATCTADGSESIHCSVCNAVKDGSERKISKLGHKYGEWQVVKAETCTKDGSKEKVCSVCGDKITGTIPATGHNFGKWTVTKKATVDEEGVKERTCSICGEKETASVEKLSAQVAAAEAVVEAEEAANKAESAANEAARLQEEAEKAAKTPGDDAIAAAKKAKEAAEAAQKAAVEAKTAADEADSIADKAKARAKNIIEAAAANEIKKKSATQVTEANSAVAKANEAVKTAEASVKKAEEDKADHIGTPEVKLSAGELTYKYKVQKVKVGKKKKTQKVETPQKPAVEAVSLNGKVIKPENYDVVWSNEESKAMGTYSVTVTLKGTYSGKATASYTINPKAAKISKPAKGKKKMTVKWKKASKNDIKYKALDGYQIQYSLTSDFSSDVKTTTASKKAKSKAIKKLQSKQTYYVRIRTYKNVSGEKLYSDWSAVKSVKVK